MPVKSLGNNVVFEVYSLTIHRDAFKYFWSALCLYRVLKLSSYKGLPSKWASVCRAAWCSWVEEAGLRPSSHVLQSTQSDVQKNSDLLGAFLPSPSLSIVAILVVLCRCAYRTQQAGGLRSAHGQQLADNLVSALLQSAATWREWNIQIRFAMRWAPAWPLGEPRSADIVLPLTPAMTVDLAPWRRAINAGNDLAIAWWARIAIGGDVMVAGTQMLPLQVLLSRSCQSKATLSLYRQLVWQLGRHIEICIHRSLAGTHSQGGALQAIPRDLQALLDKPEQLDHQLARYVESGRSLTANHWHLGYCTDKGNVAGLQLQPAVSSHRGMSASWHAQRSWWGAPRAPGQGHSGWQPSSVAFRPKP